MRPDTLARSRARSSGDRALPCGGRGRTFESCRAHGPTKPFPAWPKPRNPHDENEPPLHRRRPGARRHATARRGNGSTGSRGSSESGISDSGDRANRLAGREAKTGAREEAAAARARAAAQRESDRLCAAEQAGEPQRVLDAHRRARDAICTDTRRRSRRRTRRTNLNPDRAGHDRPPAARRWPIRLLGGARHLWDRWAYPWPS
jgi:hypothetical protein